MSTILETEPFIDIAKLLSRYAFGDLENDNTMVRFAYTQKSKVGNGID